MTPLKKLNFVMLRESKHPYYDEEILRFAQGDTRNVSF